jgi:hypothetical protein
MDRVDSGAWEQVSSEVALWEIRATPDPVRRDQMLRLLPDASGIFGVTPDVFDRARQFEELGLRGMDSLHLAACEAVTADVFVTCDDRLLRWCRRHQRRFTIRATSPVELINA